MPRGSLTRRGALTAAAALALPAIRRSYADAPVSLISHRYPGLEYYAEKIKTALPGVPVEARLMQAPEAIQLSRIALSARSNQMDLIWANNIVLASFAKSGWLEPLDDLWAKHAQEFNLGDISSTLVKSCMYDGHIYGMPLTVNTTMYAYRADLYEEKGLKPATTWDGYIENAKALTSPPRRYGATIAMKSDMVANEMNAVLNTVGDGWFDKDWRPTFNSARGIDAVETYKRLSKFTVPGFTAVHNDEHTVNMSQDIAAQGQQWATRCSTMDNPDKSRVVGKVKWTVMPSGGRQVLVSDIYTISRYSAKDKDVLFRIIASALREENQRGAAAMAVPTRQTVVKDPALAEKFRWYPAVSEALAIGQPMPSLPEFSEASEVINKRIVQAVVGQMETKAALDTAATEVQAMLTERGYYTSSRVMWLFMVPSMAVMAVVLLYPLGSAIYFSFLRYFLDGGTTRFIGLSNYAELLTDERFWGDMATTFIIVGFSVAAQFVIGMGLALGLYALTRGARLISLLNFLPNVVTPVVGAIFLKWLFIGRFGLIDSTLLSLDLFPPDWLGDPIWAKVTLIIADTWKFTPFLMLVLYAGLQAFDTQLLEAAEIDGANPWQRLRYIILPMMKPLILFVISIRAMDAFRFFDLVYVLTAGGPGTATETITLYTYQLGFRMLDVGKASALGVLTLIVVATMIASLIWFMRRSGREAF